MTSHMTVFHADLSDVRKDVDYFMAINGELHPLQPHTGESRRRARGEAPHLGSIPDERLTHFTARPVAMSSAAAIRVHVAYRNADGSRPKKGPHAGHASIYIPPSEAALAAAGGAPLHEHVDWIKTAKTFLAHHADLNAQDPAVKRAVWEHMDQHKAAANYELIEELAAAMREAGEPSDEAGQGWAALEAVQYKGEDLYLHQPRQTILDAAQPALRALMLSTKNDVRLKDKKWRQLEGFSTQPLSPQLVGTLSADGSWSASLEKSFYVDGTKAKLTVTDADAPQRIVRIEIENIFVRYLAAYIQFIGADGQPLKKPDWTPEGGIPGWIDILQKTFPDLKLQEDDFRLLGTIDPIDTILAVPNPLLPGQLVGAGDGWGVRVKFPDNAVAAGVYCCGLGTGARPHAGACLYGGAFTVLCNLLVPALLIAFDVASKSYKPLYKFIQQMLRDESVKIGGVLYYLGKKLYSLIGSAIHGHPDWTQITSTAKLLFGKGFEFLLEWIEKDLAENGVEQAAVKVAEQIPFAGWIVSAASILADVAQMAETVVEVVSSPWESPNAIHTEITSNVRLKPDPRAGRFPDKTPNQKAGYSIKMVYKRGTPSRVWHRDNLTDTPKSIELEFRNPLGDEVKLEAEYLIDGEVRATATTGWLPNDPKNARTFELMLVNRPVELTTGTVYRHSSLLTWQGGAYTWMSTAQAPDATYEPDTRQTGNAISEWNGLALSQRRHRLGWAWKAAGLGLRDCAGGSSFDQQLHAFMTAGIPGTAVEDRFPNCGFTGRSNVLSDPFPPRFLMKDGQWVLDKAGNPVPDPSSADLGDYWVDPRKAPSDLTKPLAPDGGYHLRHLDGGPIDRNASLLSYGRFLYAPESMAIHPSGYVVGLSHQFHKIQVARLDPTGAPDDRLPIARVYSGKGTSFDGSGGRPGLLVLPIAVTCTYDGTLLILENLRSESFRQARIQAFDIQGNPVDAFRDGADKPSPFLELPAENRTYLDVTAVGDKRRTYVFALYYEGKGDKASDYRLAVYQTGDAKPPRNPLLTTEGVSAARIAADMWNTVYALNYAMTTDGAGHPAGPKSAGTGPAGRTVPSLSAWVPGK